MRHVVRGAVPGRVGGRLCVAAVLMVVAGCSSSGSNAAQPSGTLVVGSGPSADDVRFQLERDGVFRRAVLGPDDDTAPLFCGVDLLGTSQDGRYLYAWALCQTFTVTGDTVEEASGVSLPVRVDVFFQKVATPVDGAGYASSVRAMFPADLAERALDQDVHVDQDAEALRRRAVAVLVAHD